MKRLTITALFAWNICVLFGQQMSPENQQVVANFINSIKNQKINEPDSKIAFPLEREYPIPQINSKEEFLRRYREVFDDSLINLIVQRIKYVTFRTSLSFRQISNPGFAAVFKWNTFKYRSF